jgi:hypothetical protein
MLQRRNLTCSASGFQPFFPQIARALTIWSGAYNALKKGIRKRKDCLIGKTITL